MNKARRARKQGFAAEKHPEPWPRLMQWHTPPLSIVLCVGTPNLVAFPASWHPLVRRDTMLFWWWNLPAEVYCSPLKVHLAPSG